MLSSRLGLFMGSGEVGVVVPTTEGLEELRKQVDALYSG